MAMGGQHRILNDVANDFAARQFSRINLTPLGQQRTRRLFVAVVQRIPNVGEVVAELAKAQRDIQNGHAPDKGQQHIDSPQQPMHQHRCQRGHHDSE